MISNVTKWSVFQNPDTFTPVTGTINLPQCVVHGHNQEKYIQEGKIFCTYSHTMRPEGASNEAINTSSIEAIMKQQ